MGYIRDSRIDRCTKKSTNLSQDLLTLVIIVAAHRRIVLDEVLFPVERRVEGHVCIIVVSLPELWICGDLVLEPALEIGQDFACLLLVVSVANAELGLSPVEMLVAFVCLVGLEVCTEMVARVVRSPDLLHTVRQHTRVWPVGAVTAHVALQVLASLEGSTTDRAVPFELTAQERLLAGRRLADSHELIILKCYRFAFERNGDSVPTDDPLLGTWSFA